MAHAMASIEPSEAWPEIALSKTGTFGFAKFHISMEVSDRERANNFLQNIIDWQKIHNFFYKIVLKAVSLTEPALRIQTITAAEDKDD